ncbi:D-alanyl-D-alanine carboxypeptidase family protein [Peribacillus sp. SCS-37]|uniref:D-alanyl-D-alanine carboxypeptidase family protein n=1 Tax=Paraperibacillus esterisolvens TaxID=3115296 RepID=UPI003905F91B
MKRLLPLASVLAAALMLSSCGTSANNEAASDKQETKQESQNKSESPEKNASPSNEVKDSRAKEDTGKQSIEKEETVKEALEAPKAEEKKPSVPDSPAIEKKQEPAEQKEKAPSAPASKPAEKPRSNAPVKPAAPAAPASPPKEDIKVTAQPDAIPVLINKQNKLPDNYAPSDLVYTKVPFIFAEKLEKKKMRKEASDALNRLFAGAKADNIKLLGVSAYRSYATQTALFNAYVKKDGYEKASTYSAVPGTSEHQTGLSIDVTGGSGACPAESCFGATKEAKWLKAHAAEYGFIIRYPEGKSSITGYKYEPWHLRYVGKSMASEIMSRGITLEEYLNAVPVSK